MGKLSRAAEALREFAGRYRAYAELADMLVEFGGLVGAAERASEAAAKARVSEQIAHAAADSERTKLAELVRKYHNAVAEVSRDRRVQVR